MDGPCTVYLGIKFGAELYCGLPSFITSELKLTRLNMMITYTVICNQAPNHYEMMAIVTLILVKFFLRFAQPC